MDVKSIQEILKFVNKSALSEVEIEQQDFRLRVKKSGSENVIYSNIPVQQTMPQVTAPPVVASATEAPPADAPAKTDASAATESKGSEKLFEFKSPMIGTFYRSSAPDKDPFCKVGDQISKGQVLCIVEAMKLFNEIEADFEGKIVKILVENAQPVEYDQPLFLIEPN